MEEVASSRWLRGTFSDSGGWRRRQRLDRSNPSKLWCSISNLLGCNMDASKIKQRQAGRVIHRQPRGTFSRGLSFCWKIHQILAEEVAAVRADTTGFPAPVYGSNVTSGLKKIRTCTMYRGGASDDYELSDQVNFPWSDSNLSTDTTAQSEQARDKVNVLLKNCI